MPSLVHDIRSDADRAADARLGRSEGLDAGEARARAERYGPNGLEERRRSVLRELLGHFWAPIPWMIEAALVLTALTGRWVDFGIILALLLLNGVVGFWEEHQAAGALAALEERLARRADVLRDGEWRTIRAEEIVPGDLVRVERGAIVPADGLLADGVIESDESALTGESLPVAKDPGDEVLSGTIVVRGTARARILATGAATQLGRTAALTGQEPRPSHFQKAMLAIGRDLIVLALALVGVIIVVSAIRGESVAETLEFALVVTVASIPVALPAVLSVTMAVGARGLARHQAVVSHLPAVEEMSGVDVLCADKTGTITENRLAIADVVPLADGADRDAVLAEAAMTAETEGADPVDRAILAALPPAAAGPEVVAREPFDAARKRAVATIRDDAGREARVAKGAVQAILALVDDDAAASRAERATAELARRGFRSLAVSRDDGEGWRLRGLIAIQDPPRDDSRSTLEEATRLGVRVAMVTGDRAEIARETAREVGMGDHIIGREAIERADAEELGRAAEEADGFAQVVPEDKYRIVAALQERGHIVAMTGDGVNDAPALARADAGVAVSGATDAARAAADIVLLAPGLSVLVEAIARAREVFRRMTNYAIYRVTETIRVVVFATVAIVAFGFFPVTAAQVVLLAILNDAAILTIAYDRVRPSPRPERWSLGEVLTIAGTLGIAGVVSSLGAVLLGLGPLGLDHGEIQTLLYLKLSVAGHLTLFVARTRGRFWSERPATVLLLAVVGTQLLATLIAGSGFLMDPLPWPLIAVAWGYALAWMLVLDQIKVLAYAVIDRRARASA